MKGSQKDQLACKSKGSKYYGILGKRESNQVKLLKLLSEYLPIKKIAKLTNKGVRQVYKSFKVYQKNSWINQDRSLTSQGFQKVQLACRCMAKGSLKQNSIRLHDLRFKVKVYNKNYPNNRKKILQLRNISSNTINMGFWKQEQIIIDNYDIRLNPHYVEFIMGSYYGESSFDAFSRALSDLRTLTINLQRKLKIKLFNDKYLDFEVTRNHYALIKNQLAQEYNKKGKKLLIYDDLGMLRLIIDNSLKLNEFEAVNKERGLNDSEKVQRFFREDILEKGLSLATIDNNLKENEKRIINLSENQLNTTMLLQQMSKNINHIVKRIK